MKFQNKVFRTWTSESRLQMNTGSRAVITTCIPYMTKFQKLNVSGTRVPSNSGWTSLNASNRNFRTNIPGGNKATFLTKFWLFDDLQQPCLFLEGIVQRTDESRIGKQKACRENGKQGQLVYSRYTRFPFRTFNNLACMLVIVLIE